MMGKRYGRTSHLAAIVFIILCICFALYLQNDDNPITKFFQKTFPQEVPANVVVDQNSLIVHYIDVGQADCTVLLSGGDVMVIDSGIPETAQIVVDYLKKLGIEEITYLVATHPHDDHIGGMPALLKNFSVKNFITSNGTSTSYGYELMLKAIKASELTISVPKPGDTFNLGQSVKITALSPSPDEVFEELNNYSVVLRAECGDRRFLFMGDAEKEIEYSLLDSDFDVSCDVLKLGHHGSYSSSVQPFLNDANPKYAVISCSFDNTYNHPHPNVIERLNKMGVEIYRTDQDGTIIATTDGNGVSFTTLGKTNENPEAQESQENQESQ